MGRGVSSADVQVAARHSFEDETMRTSDTVSCKRAGSGHRSSTINCYLKATPREAHLRSRMHLEYEYGEKKRASGMRSQRKISPSKAASN
jgi:hypothetical protein